MENEIKYIEQRSQAIAKYSDKLRQSIKDIDTEMTTLFADAGINVADDEFKYEDGWGNTYELAILKAINDRICAICNQPILSGQELKSRFDFDRGEFGRNGEYGDVHRECPFNLESEN
jgi:RNase P subunit RPR2